jgi:hypothetical protein
MEGRIVLTLYLDQKAVDPSLLLSDEKKEVKIDKYKSKRSLDANRSLWLVLNQMAIKLLMTAEELYIKYIKEYGVFEVVLIKKEALADFKVKSNFRAYDVKGTRHINGHDMVWLACYYGSSQYNSVEFARLLDGVLTDAREMGIDLITREQESLMIEEWGK